MNTLEATRTIDKTVRLGRVPYTAKSTMDVFCRIQIKDGKLSISGVEGPLPDGNAKGSCGQIDMHLRDQIASIAPAPNWTLPMLRRFFAIWEEWHLNDMRAGSKPQMDWLKANPIPKEEYAYPKSHYEVAGAKLQAAGLNPDEDGYHYGHAWKCEELPDDVSEFLAALPDTDKQPAWV